MRAIRAVLDRIDTLSIPSHTASPINHIHLRTVTPSFDIAGEEGLLQDIVDEVLA